MVGVQVRRELTQQRREYASVATPPRALNTHEQNDVRLLQYCNTFPRCCCAPFTNTLAFFPSRRSPVHQVVTTGVERTSFVFFYYPNFDAKLLAATSSACAGSREIPGGGAGVGNSAGNVTTSALPSPPAAESDADILTAAREGNQAEEGEAAAAAAATTAAAGGVPATAVAGIGPYNTLLDLKRGVASGSGGGSGGATAEAEDESFGEYLARKWGAVFRE